MLIIQLPEILPYASNFLFYSCKITSIQQTGKLRYVHILTTLPHPGRFPENRDRTTAPTTHGENSKALPDPKSKGPSNKEAHTKKGGEKSDGKKKGDCGKKDDGRKHTKKTDKEEKKRDHQAHREVQTPKPATSAPSTTHAVPPKKSNKTGAKSAGVPANKGKLPACINPLDFADSRKTTSGQGSTATIGQALREVQNQPDEDVASSKESEDPVENKLPRPNQQ